MSALRSALRSAFKRVIALYFRDIEVTGERPTAETRGRIFAANHVNGLVDPVLVLTTAPCLIAPVAKSTLWKIPGLRWLLDAAHAVPILRKKDDPTQNVSANDDVFARVAQRLREGGNILIFPEGTSHNEPHLVAVKTGAGRMLAAAVGAGAQGAHAATALTYQAVGLEFDARDTFRSRALVVYGKVRSVDAMLTAGVSREGDALARAITAQIRDDLDGLVLEAPSWDERRLIARVASLYANDQGDTSLAAWAALGHRIELAKRTLAAEDAELHADVVAKVDGYYALLEGAGALDADVARGDAQPLPRWSRWSRFPLLAAISWPLAMVGVILYAAPYQLPRAIARLARNDHDVKSTYKIGTGLIAFPAWALLLLGLAIGLFRATPYGLAIAVLLVVTSPFAAILWLDRRDARGAGRAFDAATRQALTRARAEAMSGLARGREMAERAEPVLRT